MLRIAIASAIAALSFAAPAAAQDMQTTGNMQPGTTNMGNQSYPVCTRGVTDNCIQAHERGTTMSTMRRSTRATTHRTPNHRATRTSTSWTDRNGKVHHRTTVRTRTRR